MKIAGITDIHGDLTFLKKAESYIRNADIVFISGDITHFGGVPEAEAIIKQISEINSRIYAVSGNCDSPEIEVYLEKEGMLPLLSSISSGDTSLSVSGTGGSLAGPVKTPHTKHENDFVHFYENLAGNAEIVISHQPPYKTFADKVMGHLHTGSKALRAYIDGKQPVLCLCGHIHESSGKEYYGNTLVINPGPFKEGRLAVINITDSGKAEAEIINLT